MGTRADFYIEKDNNLVWLGSVAWDGYDVEKSLLEDNDVASLVKFSKTEKDYLAALSNYAQERIDRRSDWISPEEGWPWPWDNSHTTDRAYVFRNGCVDCYSWGQLMEGMDENGEYPEGEPPKDDRFPDMSSIKNVKDAGFLILRGNQ